MIYSLFSFSTAYSNGFIDDKTAIELFISNHYPQYTSDNKAGVREFKDKIKNLIAETISSTNHVNNVKDALASLDKYYRTKRYKKSLFMLSEYNQILYTLKLIKENPKLVNQPEKHAKEVERAEFVLNRLLAKSSADEKNILKVAYNKDPEMNQLHRMQFYDSFKKINVGDDKYAHSKDVLKVAYREYKHDARLYYQALEGQLASQKIKFSIVSSELKRVNKKILQFFLNNDDPIFNDSKEFIPKLYSFYFETPGAEVFSVADAFAQIEGIFDSGDPLVLFSEISTKYASAKNTKDLAAPEKMYASILMNPELNEKYNLTGLSSFYKPKSLLEVSLKEGESSNVHSPGI